jgi:hypothetical protein
MRVVMAHRHHHHHHIMTIVDSQNSPNNNTIILRPKKNSPRLDCSSVTEKQRTPCRRRHGRILDIRAGHRPRFQEPHDLLLLLLFKVLLLLQKRRWWWWRLRRRRRRRPRLLQKRIDRSQKRHLRTTTTATIRWPGGRRSRQHDGRPCHGGGNNMASGKSPQANRMGRQCPTRRVWVGAAAALLAA